MSIKLRIYRPKGVGRIKSIQQQITIHAESVDCIQEVYGSYTESAEPIPKEIKNWCVIHTYPVEDTYTQDGDLNGYHDAIFFKVKVFDTHKKIVYCSEKLFDAIRIEKLCEVRYFKDLSSMYILRDGAKIGNYQVLEIS